MAIVEVKPLDLPKWHGKRGKEAFAQPKTIQVLVDPKTGKYATGLSEEEAESLSKKMKLDLSDTFIPEKEHPYWSTRGAQIRLENSTMFFNTDNIIEYIKVKNMKASKHVANSMKEYEEGLWDEATHVIFDESEEATVKASKIQKRNKAITLANSMSLEEKANMVLILAGKVVKTKSADFIEVALDEAIDNSLDDFLMYAQMDTKETQIRATLLEGIERSILNKQGSAIFYMDERIGFDMNEAIDWFQDVNNQKLKVAILDKMTK